MRSSRQAEPTSSARSGGRSKKQEEAFSARRHSEISDVEDISQIMDNDGGAARSKQIPSS